MEFCLFLLSNCFICKFRFFLITLSVVGIGTPSQRHAGIIFAQARFSYSENVYEIAVEHPPRYLHKLLEDTSSPS